MSNSMQIHHFYPFLNSTLRHGACTYVSSMLGTSWMDGQELGHIQDFAEKHHPGVILCPKMSKS